MHDDELDLAEMYYEGVAKAACPRVEYHRPILASGSIEDFDKATGKQWNDDETNAWQKERDRIARLEREWEEELKRRK